MKIIKRFLFEFCRIIAMLWVLGVTSIVIPYKIIQFNSVLGYASGAIFWCIAIGFVIYSEIYCESDYIEEL